MCCELVSTDSPTQIVQTNLHASALLNWRHNTWKDKLWRHDLKITIENDLLSAAHKSGREVYHFPVHIVTSAFYMGNMRSSAPMLQNYRLLSFDDSNMGLFVVIRVLVGAE